MTIKSEYDRLSSGRSPYLQRARECSKFTLPWLVPAEGASGSTRLRVTYSSFGARIVNSLSAKLILTLFPARQSFFRLSVSKRLENALGGKAQRAEIEKGLSSVETEVQEEINTTPTRTPAGEAVKHLLVSGNALVYVQPEGGLKVYSLNQYVVKRDKAGNPLRIIVEEKVALEALPEGVREVVEAKIKALKNNSDKAESEVAVYTSIKRVKDQWTVRQEVEGIAIPKSNGTYPLDASPWLPLRWIPDATGDYGRGLVEDYLGHLVSLESLTASVVKATAVASKVVFLRAPNSSVNAKKLTSASTGDVIDGGKDDVHVLEVGKQVDLATARQMIADIKEELAYAFVLNQAIQRNAERVTAEEIRFMASELDANLGGNYSTLSQEFQLPYLRVTMLQMQKAGRLPQLPKGSIRPIIVTGLDALGRGADLENLKALVKDIVDLGGPEALNTYLNFDNLLTRLTTARGVTPDGLIKSADEVAAAEQQAQMQKMIQQLGPNAINQIGGIAKQSMAPEQKTQ